MADHHNRADERGEPTREQMDLMEQATDLLAKCSELHDATHHVKPGHTCLDFRMRMIATVANALQIRPDHFGEFLKYLIECQAAREGVSPFVVLQRMGAIAVSPDMFRRANPSNN